MLDIGLPFALEKKVKAGKASAPKAPATSSSDTPSGNSAVQEMTLRRLDKKITALAHSIAPDTVWGDYTQICSYDDDAETI